MVAMMIIINQWGWFWLMEVPTAPYRPSEWRSPVKARFAMIIMIMMRMTIMVIMRMTIMVMMRMRTIMMIILDFVRHLWTWWWFWWSSDWWSSANHDEDFMIRENHHRHQSVPSLTSLKICDFRPRLPCACWAQVSLYIWAMIKENSANRTKSVTDRTHTIECPFIFVTPFDRYA